MTILCWKGENPRDGSGVVLCGLCSSLSIRLDGGSRQMHLGVLRLRFVCSIGPEYVSAHCG